MRFSRVLAAGALILAAAVAAWQVSDSWGSPVVRHRTHSRLAARGPARLALAPRQLGTFAGPEMCAVGTGCSLKPCVVFVQGASASVAAPRSGAAVLQVAPVRRQLAPSAQSCPLGDRGPGIRPGSSVPVSALTHTPVRVP